MENLGRCELDKEGTHSSTIVSLDDVDIIRSSLGARYLKDMRDVQEDKNLQSNHLISGSGSQTKHALDDQFTGHRENERNGQRSLHSEQSDKMVKNSLTPPKVLKNSLFNTETTADTKSQIVKKLKHYGDRELKSPISFINNEHLPKGSTKIHRSGRQSVPILTHKHHHISQVFSNDHFSLQQPLFGSEKANSTKPSNVLNRVVGRQAINLFYRTKPERPQSVSQSPKSSSEVYSFNQIVDPNLERSYSDNALQHYHNTLDKNEILEDFKRTSHRIEPGKNFQDSLHHNNVTSTDSFKYLDDTHFSCLDSQILEDTLTQPGEISETTPLIGKTKTDSRTHVYKKRWYLLFLFSLTAMLWSAVWSTWGPIAQSAKNVYEFDDADIAMFTWLGNIPFLVTMFPIAYLMDVKGMRTAMILCCGLIFLGSGVRCIPSDNLTTKWLIYGGQLLNGIAGTVPMSGSALLSGLWFPSNQRATATAISTIAGYFGASISFVFGPLFVPDDGDDTPGNLTYEIFSSSSNDSDIAVQKSHIEYILYSECGAAGLLLILVIIYFPSKPILPPSISASMPREKYLDGLKLLVRNKQFWVTAIAFSFPAGVYEAWQVVLDVNLDPKVSQTTAGWMDFYATVGGCVSGMLVSRFADYFTRQMKLFLLIFYFFAAIAFLWCTFIVTDILPFDTASLYAAIILGGVFLDGGAPLFFELVIEVSYPVGEGVTSGCVQMICSLAGIIFLSVVQINTIDKQWMNWCFFGTITMAIPLLFLVKATYGRADVDDLEVSVEEDSQSVNQ
ncbi:hypothetical protein Btru_071895 [Bulinus truncatus]|nr:hypothetical protein Btru_071895 [Bulinus truncatus]